MSDDRFFFGCWRDVGHYLRDSGGRSRHDSNVPADFPCPTHILDAGFLPPLQPEVQGHVHVWRTNGWIVAAWWDRTVDTRGKSNAAFIMRSDGTESFEEIMSAFDESFPHIAKRYREAGLELVSA